MYLTQAEMIEMLKTGLHTVSFTKKNGEARTIVGSLPADAGPQNEANCPIVEASTGLGKSFPVHGSEIRPV